MDIRERETLALVAALTEFQVEIPKMETIQPIFTYPLEMNPLTLEVRRRRTYVRKATLRCKSYVARWGTAPYDNFP